MIDKIGLIFLSTILVVSCKDFDQETCPNNCSYQPHQVTTINCQGQHDLGNIPKTSTHLIFEGCRQLQRLNIQSLGNIVSVTILNSTIEQNPVHFFTKFSHIKCLRFEAVTFNRNSSLDDYFKPLINLEFIEFNFTHLTHAEMQDLLRGFTKKHKLNSLILTQQGLGGVNISLGGILEALNDTMLTCLTLQHEKHRNLNLPILKNVAPHLEILNFHKCLWFPRNEWGIQNILSHKNLKVIGITYYNNVLIWPDTYLSRNHHRPQRSLNYINGFIKDSTEQYIKENNFSFIEKCTGDRLLLHGSLMPPIEKILFQHSDIRIINSYSMSCFFAHEFHVKMIDFSYSLVLKDLYGLNFIFHGFDNLRYFNAEGNLVDNVPAIFFHFLPRLETLLLGKNKLGNVIKGDHEGVLFSKLSSLKFLDLHDNNLQSIHSATFSGLHKLKTLNLSKNIITSFEIDFTSLKSLGMLDLHSNMIYTLSIKTTNSLDTVRRLYNSSILINLRENQLRCSCGDLEFIKWFQETEGSVFYDYSTLNCSNTYGKMESLALVNLQSLNTFCDPLTTGEIAVIVVPVVLFAFITVLVYVIYKKRHQWRYWVFRMYYYRNKDEDSESYLYDAYVCYSSDDSEFVHNILRPTLEDTYNFRLCIDKRDFEVGTFITNNILESIEQSRKTLLVFSPSFLESDWCKYEMHMAYSKLLHYGVDVIVPLLYKSFDLTNTDRTLRAIITKKTYIEWNEGRGRFWDHLCLILNDGKSQNTTV